MMARFADVIRMRKKEMLACGRKTISSLCIYLLYFSYFCNMNCCENAEIMYRYGSWNKFSLALRLRITVLYVFFYRKSIVSERELGFS